MSTSRLVESHNSLPTLSTSNNISVPGTTDVKFTEKDLDELKMSAGLGPAGDVVNGTTGIVLPSVIGSGPGTVLFRIRNLTPSPHFVSRSVILPRIRTLPVNPAVPQLLERGLRQLITADALFAGCMSTMPWIKSNALNPLFRFTVSVGEAPTRGSILEAASQQIVVDKGIDSGAAQALSKKGKGE
jgi:hypothetical protein